MLSGEGYLHGIGIRNVEGLNFDQTAGHIARLIGCGGFRNHYPVNQIRRKLFQAKSLAVGLCAGIGYTIQLAHVISFTQAPNHGKFPFPD